MSSLSQTCRLHHARRTCSLANIASTGCQTELKSALRAALPFQNPARQVCSYRLQCVPPMHCASEWVVTDLCWHGCHQYKQHKHTTNTKQWSHLCCCAVDDGNGQVVCLAISSGPPVGSIPHAAWLLLLPAGQQYRECMHWLDARPFCKAWMPRPARVGSVKILHAVWQAICSKCKLLW